MVAREDVLYCAVPDADCKRGQPPFRYRCKSCGPTQEDFA